MRRAIPLIVYVAGFVAAAVLGLLPVHMVGRANCEGLGVAGALRMRAGGTTAPGGGSIGSFEQLVGASIVDDCHRHAATRLEEMLLVALLAGGAGTVLGTVLPRP